MAADPLELEAHSDPAEINNPDVEFVAWQFERLAEEAQNAQSNDTSDFKDADKTRIVAIVDKIDDFVAWALKLPEFDLPETSKRKWKVVPELVLVRKDNDVLSLIARLGVTYRDEALHSQSARAGSGLRKDDAKRFMQGTEKIRQLIVDYVNGSDPLDLPASTPSFPSVDGGKHGV